MGKGLLKPHASRISFVQRLLDGSLIFVVYWILASSYSITWDSTRLTAVALAIILFTAFAEVRGIYLSWRTSSLLDEIRILATTWLWVVFVLLLMAFATKTSEIFSRLVLLSWFVLVPICLAALRVIARGALRYARRHGANIRTVAVIGHNPIGHHLIQHLQSMHWAGLSVKGVFDRSSSGEGAIRIGREDYPIGSVEDLVQEAKSAQVDSIYIALPLRDEDQIDELVNQFADTTVSVYVVPDLFISELMHSRWIDLGGMPVVSIFESPFHGLDGWIKRAEDLILGSLILLLISPILLLIAIAVKLTSSGPVIFKQRRYGLNGAVVEVWKFRSMTVCEDGDHISQATKGDMRVTRVGAFLRKTSLDELPQFFNVLQGRMSIVGPRPHAIAHNEQYRKLIKGYMLRHKVRPGITGWAQINGWRGETDTLEKMQKRIEFDMEYIQNWSLGLDIKIVILTILKGFTGNSAY